MKAIITFIAIIVSACVSGCAGHTAQVSYTPAPSPAVGNTTPPSRPVITRIPRPVTYSKDSVMVVNNNPKGMLVDFYVGNRPVLVGLPAGDRATIYPRSTVDGEHIAFGTVTYTLSPTGERQVVGSFNRTLRMGSRNQFATIIWEVNPKGNPRISTSYSYDRGYVFGR